MIDKSNSLGTATSVYQNEHPGVSTIMQLRPAIRDGRFPSEASAHYYGLSNLIGLRMVHAHETACD
jgi:hypothetical protein